MNNSLYSEENPPEKWTSRERFLGALIILILVVFAVGLVYKANISPKTYYDFIPSPVQSSINTPESLVIQSGQENYTLTKVASYEVQAVVKGIKKYNDPLAPIAPFDFALAWGQINTKAVDEHIKYTQSGRWYYYNIDDLNIVDLGTVAQSSSNHHIVPADEKIRSQLSKIRENDYVKLKGYLVNIHYKDQTVNTSTTRTDSGGGACEVLLVTEVAVK